MTDYAADEITIKWVKPGGETDLIAEPLVSAHCMCGKITADARRDEWREVDCRRMTLRSALRRGTVWICPDCQRRAEKIRIAR